MTEKLDKLRELVRNKRKVLISTHTNPDPDTIASAYGMRELLAKWGINSVLVYGGMIGRAENKAMINRLRIPLRSIQTINPFNFKVVALIDGQPSAGNDPLPPSIMPSIVIDHHPARKRTLLRRIPFVDIRPDYGSTSTIIAEYLYKSGVEINRRLATALFYGIKADTRDMGRDVHEIDIKMSGMLYPKVLVKTLSMVENPRLPKEYFRIIQKALGMTVWYPGQGALVCELGTLMDPDMVAVAAEFLAQMEGARWVIVFGQRDRELFFSIRTSSGMQGHADGISRFLVKGVTGGSAGGHGQIAGGKVDLPNAQIVEEVKSRLKERFVKKMGCDPAKGMSLV